MFGQTFEIWFYLFSYRSEVVINEITHSCRIYNGSVVKLSWVRYCSCNVLKWNYIFDSFSSISNVIPVTCYQLLPVTNVIQVFCIINLWEKRRGLCMFLYVLYLWWNLFEDPFYLWIFISFFLIEIDF